MSTLYVRDVSAETLAELKKRAVRKGQSLQAYARNLLEREAAIPEMESVLADIREHATAKLSTEEVLADIEEGRRR